MNSRNVSLPLASALLKLTCPRGLQFLFLALAGTLANNSLPRACAQSTAPWYYQTGSSGPVYNNNNVGIATAVSHESLQVGPVFSMFSTSVDVALRYNAYWTGSGWNYLTSTNKAGQIFFNSSGMSISTSNTAGTAGGAIPDFTTRFSITAAGNVGIGTTSPAHLLHVAGTIGAEEVIVSATGADYVFGPRYDLKRLNEVAAFIEQHHHLPDIPSTTEVQANGVNVGEMQMKLLAKVEELTLHLIREDQRNTQLEEDNRKLSERISQLEARFSPVSLDGK